MQESSAVSVAKWCSSAASCRKWGDEHKNIRLSTTDTGTEDYTRSCWAILPVVDPELMTSTAFRGARRTLTFAKQQTVGSDTSVPANACEVNVCFSQDTKSQITFFLPLNMWRTFMSICGPQPFLGFRDIISLLLSGTEFEMFRGRLSYNYSADLGIHWGQGSQTRGPLGHCVRPAMLFGNFQINNIHVIYFIHRCLKVFGQRVNKFLSNERIDG